MTLTRLKMVATLAAVFILCFCSYLKGHSDATTEFQLLAEQAEKQNLKHILTVERQKAQGLSDLQTEAENEKRKINDNFNSAINSLNGVHDSSARQVSMSEASNNSDRLKDACTYRLHKKNAKHIGELLKVARDCDELAERYNRLLKLYELNAKQ